jgi:xanthine dehydrogenase accessory factor
MQMKMPVFSYSLVLFWEVVLKSLDSEDARLLETIISCLKVSERCSLVTVLETYGSAPRSPGALLMVSESGRFMGSVSGGCIEERLIEGLIKQPIADIELRIFGLDNNERARLQLPCGGQIKVLIEPILSSDIQHFESMLQGVLSRKNIVRTLNLNTGEAVLEHGTGLFQVLQFDKNKVQRCYGPSWRLIIIGAMHLSEYLCEFATMLGFNVIVCDPREEYCENFTTSNCTLVKAVPEDYLASINLDANTALVSVAHDPKIDEFAIIEALKSDAFYVGALGSKRTAAKRLKRLHNEWQLEKNHIEKLHGPVGLSIGSKTPVEIAISIASHLVAQKNKAMTP